MGGGWNLDQALQGGMGGAMSGGAAGGGWGALAGGAAGWLIGGLSDDPMEDFMKDLARMRHGLDGRRAPKMGPANTAGASGLTTNRAALIAQLEAQARGEGPSAARLQMKAAADRTAQMLASNANGAGGRGVNQGAAMRNAGAQAGSVMQKNNQDMGVLRAQEQLNAMSQLGQNINAGVTADNALNTWNAGAQNTHDYQQAQMDMDMFGMNDRAKLQILQMQMGKAPQGMGTSLMAGGATSAPMIMQMMNQQNQGQQQQQTQSGHAAGGSEHGAPTSSPWDE
jgi:hypothetical protein